MPSLHIVREGEYVSGIAKNYGLTCRKVWNDSQNAELKQQRKSPNILFPGDQLVIPDKQERIEDRPTDERHKFKALIENLNLHLVIQSADAEPAAQSDYTLTVDSHSVHKQTDGTGDINEPIEPGAHKGLLVLQDDDLALDLKVTLAIGDLDPIETATGQIARLNNLGYAAGEVQDPPDDASRKRVQSAVEEFQCDEKLTVDGLCGPQTQAKLKLVYGC